MRRADIEDLADTLKRERPARYALAEDPLPHVILHRVALASFGKGPERVLKNGELQALFRR